MGDSTGWHKSYIGRWGVGGVRGVLGGGLR